MQRTLESLKGLLIFSCLLDSFALPVFTVNSNKNARKLVLKLHSREPALAIRLQRSIMPPRNSSRSVCLGPPKGFLGDSIPQRQICLDPSAVHFMHICHSRASLRQLCSPLPDFLVQAFSGSVIVTASAQKPGVYHDPLLPHQAAV